MSDETPIASAIDRLRGRDFIRAIVADDLERGTHGGRVVTRFPPEPNGYLHIGHAKAIALSFGIASEVPGAVCHLRFDDTNPETEDEHYVRSIQDSVRWLGFDWGEHLYFASDYFETMYGIAEHLIRTGHAYVDSQTDEQIREGRGTVTSPGTNSPFRDRSADESLDLFRRMRAGEFPNGAHVLRGRIDMGSPNMLMRDPVLYRIRHASHYRTGDAWCIYPLYDYAHCIEDALECVTHSFCTLEFEINRELYDWVLDHAPVSDEGHAIRPGCRPRQYEFARGNLDYTVMSKRKLLELVKEGRVSGWDDPRMPTIAGLRRRGVTPEAILAFWDMVGVAKTESRVDIGKLEFAIRDDLNPKVPRVLCVLRPLKVTITNWPGEGSAGRGGGNGDGNRRNGNGGDGDGGSGTGTGTGTGHGVDWIEAPLYPHDVPLEGSRSIPFSGELYIERDDFAEEPPKGWKRLSPGAEVRLRYGYFIRCEEVVKDEAGEVVELRCTYDPDTRGGESPDGRKPKGTIHWVDAERSLPCQVRLYDRLFTVPDPEAEGEDWKAFLNPESLVVLEGARVEPSVADDPPGTRYQFERLGYFMSDPEDSKAGALVFNRTVTLRDTWGLRRAGAGAEAGKTDTAEAGRSPGAAVRREGGPAGTASPPRESGGPGPSERPPAETPQERSAATRRGGSATGARPQSGERAAAAPPGDRTIPGRSPALMARWQRYEQDLGLGEREAEILTRDEATADLFEAALTEDVDAKAVANWVINEVPRALSEPGGDEPAFDGRALGELVALVEAGTISSSAGREVLAEMAESGEAPATIVERLGLRQISDPDAIWPVVEAILNENPAKVDQYREGRTGLIGFFMGQVMRKTEGRADPEVARRLLTDRLG